MFPYPGIDFKAGIWQLTWKTLGQLSQQISSPPSIQTAHQSSLESSLAGSIGVFGTFCWMLLQYPGVELSTRESPPVCFPISGITSIPLLSSLAIVAIRSLTESLNKKNIRIKKIIIWLVFVQRFWRNFPTEFSGLKFSEIFQQLKYFKKFLRISILIFVSQIPNFLGNLQSGIFKFFRETRTSSYVFVFRTWQNLSILELGSSRVVPGLGVLETDEVTLELDIPGLTSPLGTELFWLPWVFKWILKDSSIGTVAGDGRDGWYVPKKQKIKIH